MHRLILVSALVAVWALVAAGPALASQCPKLIAQINAAAGNRFDTASWDARDKAMAADKLHKEGKHADSVKAAQEGLNKLK